MRPHCVRRVAHAPTRRSRVRSARSSSSRSPDAAARRGSRASARSGGSVTWPTRRRGPARRRRPTRSRAAQASASVRQQRVDRLRDAVARGRGRCAAAYCAHQQRPAGSATVWWASTQRRQAVRPGTTNGPTTAPPSVSRTTRCGDPGADQRVEQLAVGLADARPARHSRRSAVVGSRVGARPSRSSASAASRRAARRRPEGDGPRRRRRRRAGGEPARGPATSAAAPVRAGASAAAPASASSTSRPRSRAATCQGPAYASAVGGRAADGARTGVEPGQHHVVPRVEADLELAGPRRARGCRGGGSVACRQPARSRGRGRERPSTGASRTKRTQTAGPLERDPAVRCCGARGCCAVECSGLAEDAVQVGAADGADGLGHPGALVVDPDLAARPRASPCTSRSRTRRSRSPP